MNAPTNKVRALATVVALVLVLAACGGSSKSYTSSTVSASTSATSAPATSTATATSSTSPAAGAGVKVSSAAVGGLGAFLVNAQGRTLYVFAPDKAKKVTCVASCAAVWPPLALPGGQKPIAKGSIKQSLLGSDPNPSGGRVVTYAGWPLYTYVSDTSPGQDTGQALNLNGGFWYVISPSGTLITKKP